MEDAMQTGKGHKHAQKRALLFMSILLVLMVCVAAGATVRALQSGKRHILSDLELRMFAEARNRAEELTVWYGSMDNRIDQLTDKDLFRLFASEVNSLGSDIPEMAALAKKTTSLSSSGESADLMTRLAGQLPLMRTFLQEFVSQSNFLSARIISSGAQEYLSTDERAAPLSPEQEHAVREALRNSKARVLPVFRDGSGRLIMYIVRPIFAPSYVSAPDADAVAALILSCDISGVLRKVTASRRHEDGTGIILQRSDNGGFEELSPAGQGPLPAFPAWSLTEKGDLAPTMRELSDNAAGTAERIFSLGVAVQGLPWISAEYIPESVVELRFDRERKQIILSAVAATIIAALVLGIIWWWLVGRRERSIAAELRDLYQTVNRQKELLDGINGALTDGITLQDAKGDIVYANAAFASMIGKTPETIAGHAYESIFDLKGGRICRTADEVIKLGKPVSFTENMFIHGEKRHYQIACSPFRSEEGTLNGVVSVYRDITQLIKAQERTQNMIYQTIHVLVRAIEAVDPYLRGQSAQTGRLAVHLAQGLGLGFEHENTLRTAANLSQIGMIQLPPQLLKKAGELSPEERSQMERHVEYASAVLKDIDFGLPVLDAICQMHERLDGSGYPKHLQGDRIGMDGRILAVANTFCALVRPRSYRKARTVENALVILSATPPQYDPVIVEELKKFLSTPQGKEFLENLCGE